MAVNTRLGLIPEKYSADRLHVVDAFRDFFAPFDLPESTLSGFIYSENM